MRSNATVADIFRHTSKQNCNRDFAESEFWTYLEINFLVALVVMELRIHPEKGCFIPTYFTV